jgi:hypothetical protein
MAVWPRGFDERARDGRESAPVPWGPRKCAFGGDPHPVDGVSEWESREAPRDRHAVAGRGFYESTRFSIASRVKGKNNVDLLAARRRPLFCDPNALAGPHT